MQQYSYCPRALLRLFCLIPPILILLVCGTLLVGCGPRGSFAEALMGRKYNICILVDHSGSTRTDPKFANTLHGVGKVYLSQLRVGPKYVVTIRHGGSVKDVLYDSKGKGLQDIRKMLEDMADEKAHHHHHNEGDHDHDSPHADDTQHDGNTDDSSHADADDHDHAPPEGLPIPPR